MINKSTKYGWRRQPLLMSEIPLAVRESSRYDGRTHWLDVARMTVSGRWIGLWFEDGGSDLWRMTDVGGWVLHSASPPREIVEETGNPVG